jgi:hypothetical protein
MPSLLPEVDWILLDYAYDALEHILGSEQAALSWLNATARDGRVRWARLRESARYFDQPEQFPKEFCKTAVSPITCTRTTTASMPKPSSKAPTPIGAAPSPSG